MKSPSWMRRPWTSEGYKQSMNELISIYKTPKDEWDLTEEKINLTDERGGMRVITFNPLKIEFQFAKRMEKLYSDPDERLDYTMRFWMIVEFIKRNKEKMVHDGYAFIDENGINTREDIMESLFRFCSIVHPRLEFSYSEIIEFSKVLRRKND